MHITNLSKYKKSQTTTVRQSVFALSHLIATKNLISHAYDVELIVCRLMEIDVATTTVVDAKLYSKVGWLKVCDVTAMCFLFIFFRFFFSTFLSFMFLFFVFWSVAVCYCVIAKGEKKMKTICWATYFFFVLVARSRVLSTNRLFLLLCKVSVALNIN